MGVASVSSHLCAGDNGRGRNVKYSRRIRSLLNQVKPENLKVKVLKVSIKAGRIRALRRVKHKFVTLELHSALFPDKFYVTGELNRIGKKGVINVRIDDCIDNCIDNCIDHVGNCIDHCLDDYIDHCVDNCSYNCIGNCDRKREAKIEFEEELYEENALLSEVIAVLENHSSKYNIVRDNCYQYADNMYRIVVTKYGIEVAPSKKMKATLQRALDNIPPLVMPKTKKHVAVAVVGTVVATAVVVTVAVECWPITLAGMYLAPEALGITAGAVSLSPAILSGVDWSKKAYRWGKGALVRRDAH